jgi:F-box-like
VIFVPKRHVLGKRTCGATGFQMGGRRGRGLTETSGKAPSLQRISRHASTRPVTRSNTARGMAAILQRDMLEEVLKFLTPRELAGCASVCSTWRDVALSAALWKPHCEVGKRHDHEQHQLYALFFRRGHA